jgi:hypothetical protein
MEVDQKQITTIRLHDAKGGDVRLSKEGNDYQLQLTSANTVVNISMGHADIRRLCQQIMQIDMEENWKFHYAHPEFKSFFFNGAPRSYQETMANWFARMASEMPDTRSEKR